MEKLDRWVMLLAGLVGGWLFATFPGWVKAWGKEHWWNIATAFGTVGAAIGAVAIAVMGRLVETHNQKEAAKRYALANVDALMSAHAALDALTKNLELVLAGSANLDRLEEAYERLSRIDMERVGLAFPGAAQSTAEAKAILVQQIYVCKGNSLAPIPSVFKVKKVQNLLREAWKEVIDTSERSPGIS